MWRWEAEKSDASVRDAICCGQTWAQADLGGTGSGDYPAHATRPLTPAWCTSFPHATPPPPPWKSRRHRRRPNKSQRRRKAAVTAMPKNKGNAARTPGPRLLSAQSPRPSRGLGIAQAAVTFPSPYLRAAGDPGAILGLGVELGSYSCLPIWSHWGGADAIFVGPPAGECGLLLLIGARLTAARWGLVETLSSGRPWLRKWAPRVFPGQGS